MDRRTKGNLINMKVMLKHADRGEDVSDWDTGKALIKSGFIKNKKLTSKGKEALRAFK